MRFMLHAYRRSIGGTCLNKYAKPSSCESKENSSTITVAMRKVRASSTGYAGLLGSEGFAGALEVLGSAGFDGSLDVLGSEGAEV